MWTLRKIVEEVCFQTNEKLYPEITLLKMRTLKQLMKDCVIDVIEICYEFRSMAIILTSAVPAYQRQVVHI